jgi:hypothetical protein
VLKKEVAMRMRKKRKKRKKIKTAAAEPSLWD